MSLLSHTDQWRCSVVRGAPYKAVFAPPARELSFAVARCACVAYTSRVRRGAGSPSRHARAAAPCNGINNSFRFESTLSKILNCTQLRTATRRCSFVVRALAALPGPCAAPYFRFRPSFLASDLAARFSSWLFRGGGGGGGIRIGLGLSWSYNLTCFSSW